MMGTHNVTPRRRQTAGQHPGAALAPWPRVHRWLFSPRLVLDSEGAKFIANPRPRRAACMLAAVGSFGIGFVMRGFV